jgi:hypothetical protein
MTTDVSPMATLDTMPRIA